MTSSQALPNNTGNFLNSHNNNISHWDWDNVKFEFHDCSFAADDVMAHHWKFGLVFCIICTSLLAGLIALAVAVNTLAKATERRHSNNDPEKEETSHAADAPSCDTGPVTHSSSSETCISTSRGHEEETQPEVGFCARVRRFLARNAGAWITVVINCGLAAAMGGLFGSSMEMALPQPVTATQPNPRG